MSGRGFEGGFNLIELLLSIVVISISVSGVLLVFTQTVRYSADPMIGQQAVAIAEGYLDEVLARGVDDPDDVELGVGFVESGEARNTYDDVKDYSLVVGESPPRDQNGNALAGLGDYAVTVTVTPDVNIGPAGNTIPAAQVDVRVVHSNIVDLTLTGYRAN